MSETQVISTPVISAESKRICSLSCSLPGISDIELIKRHKQYRIGRNSENDIMIPYAGASRLHALVIFENNNWVVKDLKSKNGVYVQGKRVSLYKLVNGCIFFIGDCEFTFYDSDDGATSIADEPATRKKRIIYLLGAVLFILMAIGFVYLQKNRSSNALNDSSVLTLPSDSFDKPLVQDLKQNGNILPEDYSAQDSNLINDKVQELYQLGLTYYDGGELNKAANYWQQALTLAGNDAMIESRITLLFSEIDRKAENYYKLAMKDYKYMRFVDASINFKMVLELINDNNDLRNINARKFLKEIESR
jgi:tetratricopeptide (TPR) repeat protein